MVTNNIKYCKLCEKAYVDKETCPQCETVLENIGWIENDSK